jgi:hypothetical protein
MNDSKSVLLTRIELIEKELAEIKDKLVREDRPQRLTLRGIWKDIDVTDEDIEDAKRSLFPDRNDF